MTQLPLSSVPHSRVKQIVDRAQMRAELTERAARAWEGWQLVQGQVTVLNPNATKREDVSVKLDTDAILASMRLMGVPARDEAWHWDAVQSLHDINCHDARRVGRSACFVHGVSGPAFSVECDPECEGCREMFGIEAAS